MTDAADLGRPRWKGQPHRLEVWYATFTDLSTGDGFWLHHEVVAPPEGEAYGHGWLALFPSGDTPLARRFGPAPLDAAEPAWFSAAGVHVDVATLRGSVPEAGWDLSYGDSSPPLYTFPAWSWEGEVLPAAQVVPFPTARFTGSVSVGKRVHELDGAVGALARIYGHGHAERWAWLHADLGHGDVLEVVAGAPRAHGGEAVAPVPLVQLRLDGQDWPDDSVSAAPGGHADIALPTWRVEVEAGARRLVAEVTVPATASVALAYTDPDGARATCTNSERADADIALEVWDDGWREERRWSLRGTAHAEVGRRP
jgi:hypothetical protein